MKQMNRIYHTWEKWECYPAGFYETKSPGGLSKEESEQKYVELLSDSEMFGGALSKIIVEWAFSCEHYLTNANMNRIAWMGQAALAYKYGIPSCYRTGYNKLSKEQKKTADQVALKYINEWMVLNDHEELSVDAITSKTKANIY